MRKWTKGAVLTFALLALWAWPLAAGEVEPMFGGVIIDGYDYGADIGPKGSIVFDETTGEFRGYYNALKMPKGRRAIFAWVHDTVNQKSAYLGPVGSLKAGTAGKNKGRFAFKVPEQFRNGDFGSYEIVGFTSEKTGFIADGQAVQTPNEPSGSAIQKSLKPAFYLFAKLPGADTDMHYCGHGEDFFYAKAPDKQRCYD